MHATRLLTGALLAGAALFTTAAPVAAEDDPSAGPSPSGSSAGPTEAGTTFRTATAIHHNQRATARASAGDYLYWVFPADAGQRATVKATVTLPESATRHGASSWQLDIYDGLRRRQACMYGRQTKAAPQDAESVELSCTLRTVRAWAECGSPSSTCRSRTSAFRCGPRSKPPPSTPVAPTRWTAHSPLR
jgi:hypothetical protein